MNIDRVGTIFHESFSYSRKSVSKILQTISENPSIMDFKQSEREEILLERTSLGTRYIKAMPKYAIGSGVLHGDYRLTDLGRIALLFDPMLDKIGTQWLLHYHLSAPHGPGPTFWNHIVINQFYLGNIFSPENLIEQIGNFVWQHENKVLAKRSVGSTVTIFLGTYTKPEGLGKLHILEVTESGRYRVREGATAPAWALGYALLDFWEAQYPGRISVGLNTLHESNFAKLFMIGKADLEAVLRTLQEANYIEIHRTAQPFQVVLLRQDREPLLKKLYGAD